MRSSMRGGILAAAAAVALAACGGAAGPAASEDPKAALEAAVDRMAEWDGGAVTVRVDATRASLEALAAESGDDLTDEQIGLILDSALEFRSHAGADAATTEDDEAEVRLRIGTTDAFHVIVQAGTFYLRSDVEQLLELAGGDDVRADLDELVTMAEQAGIDVVDDLLAGSWLQIDGLDELASMAAGMSGGPGTPDPDEVASAQAAIVEALRGFVARDLDVTYVGDDEVGAHLRLVASGADLADLAEDVIAAAGPSLLGPSAGDQEQLLDELRTESADLDDMVLPLDVWIADGVIARIGVDMVAFAEANPDKVEDEVPAGVDRLGLLVDLERFDGGVDAPEDAVPVDLFELFGRMMAGGFSA